MTGHLNVKFTGSVSKRKSRTQL